MEERSRDILAILAHRIRVLTLDQAARTWWDGTAAPTTNARRGLGRLVSAGYLDTFTVVARPELPLSTPLATWEPTQHPPAFGSVAYRLQLRWNEAPRPTRVYVATKRAAKVVGGYGGPLRHPMQVSHDIHVTTVFLYLRTTNPSAAAEWIPEQKLAPLRRHQKLPDAALGRDPETLRRVIEFGNGYDADRLRAFHDDCEQRSLPYEVW